MSTATPTCDPVSETYLEVKGLIFDTVYKHVQLYGGDFDEMLSEANVVFMRVYKIYKPERGAFSTLLVTCIYRELTDMLRKRIADRPFWGSSIDADRGNGSMADKIQDTHVGKFDRDGFASSLSHHAQIVLNLTLNAPKEIAEIAIGKGDEPRNWRSTIRDFLYNNGWSSEEIATSFDEIRNALIG